MVSAPFDNEYYRSFNESRRDYLDSIVPHLIQTLGIRTGLDVACGFGFFSKYLRDRGLDATAFDARAENVQEAARRVPEVKFVQADLENPQIAALGCFDFVLCFGLLYHLENPFRGVRNLGQLAKKVLAIESWVAPCRRSMMLMHQEVIEPDQGINYVALIPSETCLWTMLYRSGFQYVYRPVPLPNHKEFHATLWRKRRRIMCVASKVELRLAGHRLMPEPRETNERLWYRFGVGRIVEYMQARERSRKISV